jgi:hypothetical protein
MFDVQRQRELNVERPTSNVERRKAEGGHPSLSAPTHPMLSMVRRSVPLRHSPSCSPGFRDSFRAHERQAKRRQNAKRDKAKRKAGRVRFLPKPVTCNASGDSKAGPPRPESAPVPLCLPWQNQSDLLPKRRRRIKRFIGSFQPLTFQPGAAQRSSALTCSTSGSIASGVQRRTPFSSKAVATARRASGCADGAAMT